MTRMFFNFLALALLAGFSLAAMAREEVGNVDVDLMGNDISISALADEKVGGITCHLARFERSAADRVFGMFDKKDPFQDPSNSALTCRQTGPISVGDIKTGKGGEEVFNDSISLVFKQLVVRRIYDCANDTLIYLSHSRRLLEGSAKMAMSAVPLHGTNAVWSKGRPACQ